MRALPFVVIALALLVGLPVGVQGQTSTDLQFQSFLVPAARAAEPTIGIPWNTDSVFFHSNTHTIRARFDAAGQPNFVDVTPPYQVPINLDPMLIADSDLGRIFAGGLHGPCSVMMLSDDDGDTWAPSANMCSGSNLDHQSIGIGPAAGPVPAADPQYPHIAYYCAQNGGISCARSLDAGRTWAPFQDMPGPCGGFHGHIRVSPKTGFAAVPVARCGEQHGFLSTADGGLNWASNLIPVEENWTNGFDPGLQFTRTSGWMYYAMASERGVHVALTKDEGKTWEMIGGGHGPSTVWLDIGALYDPPIVSGVFTNVQAGDDDRAAVAFFGLEAPPGSNVTFLKSNEIYQCDDGQGELIWRAYVAMTFDAGQTWSVQRVTDDPVQIGGVFDSVVDSGDKTCRNLLDFNDMDIDSHGRIYWGIGDGCVDQCAVTRANATEGYRKDVPTIFRQIGGRGLFSQYDGEEGKGFRDGNGTGGLVTGSASRVPRASSPRDTDGIGTSSIFGITVLVVAVVRRRR